MPQQLQETAKLNAIAIAEAKKTGRMLIQHISPGWGSSGYYSADVLEEAATNQVIPAGTQMFADHPTPEEAKARPVRSIKDLMSVTTEAARVATEDDVARGAELGALVSEVDVVPTYRELLEHLAKAGVGVSVRGAGDVVEGGTAEGRTGRIVESLEYVQSVDWVTRPGRGGKVLSLVESARANQRAVAHGLSEATVNDIREGLQAALRDAHGTAKDTWLYVRDFDDTTVWFELEGSGAGDEAGIYGQAYTEDDGAVSLTGERTEVRVVTKYVPATRPDSTTTATEESQEDTMGKIQIEESVHTELTEKAGRVDALIQENATKDRRIKELEEADALRVRTTSAVRIIEARAKEAGVTYSPLEVKGLCVELPIKESGELDEEKFTTSIDEDAATRKAAGGSGQIIGQGGVITESGKGVTLADIDEALGLKIGA